MEAKIMKRLQLKYDINDYMKKGCIARMIITRKSELNKLINKRTKSTHQKKISSKRTGGRTTSRKGKVVFTINDPNYIDCYNRGGLVFSSNLTTYILPFDSHFYLENIRSLEKVIKIKVSVCMSLFSLYICNP